MSKYRILETTNLDDNNSYRIQILELRAKNNFWMYVKLNDRFFETWHPLNKYGELFKYDGHSLYSDFLQPFDTLDKAKTYLECLNKKSKVVFEIEF